ncbi:MAG: glycosyltransferase family 2 protein [Acidobacteriaceae bacterium]|nr:glycosyltransferase family 2 protein [Acidobacteriaceae bacterium]MBV9781879.1 glycosyltransferase family 2 protein [Acidobacteriaceae bacterium]
MTQNGNAQPAVSVIIPAYQVSAYIAEAVDSVLAQATERVEVIVVNDGSPDTEELEGALDPYRDRIVYLKQENGGVSSARNAGIRAARGEWLALLDGDDAWLPNYLESQLAFIRDHPDVDMVFPNGVIFGDTPAAGKLMMDFSPAEGEVTFLKVLAGECTIACCSVVRREIVMGVGLFDTQLHATEDFDLWLRVLKAGGRIAYQREPLYRYRRREGSATWNPIAMNQRILESLDRAEGKIPMTDEERDALDRHRRKVKSELAIARGKQAFERRDWNAAIAHLTEANMLMPSGKVRAKLALLRFFPALVHRAYQWKRRRENQAAVL